MRSSRWSIKSSPSTSCATLTPTKRAETRLPQEVLARISSRIINEVRGVNRVVYALRIKEIAIEAGVPIVQDIALARALHARVKVNREVPADLFKGVALVLAFVYKQKKRVA